LVSLEGQKERRKSQAPAVPPSLGRGRVKNPPLAAAALRSPPFFLSRLMVANALSPHKAVLRGAGASPLSSSFFPSVGYPVHREDERHFWFLSSKGTAICPFPPFPFFFFFFPPSIKHEQLRERLPLSMIYHPSRHSPPPPFSFSSCRH